MNIDYENKMIQTKNFNEKWKTFPFKKVNRILIKKLRDREKKEKISQSKNKRKCGEENV